MSEVSTKERVVTEVFYDVEYMAKFLCVHTKTIYRYVENNILQYHRIGGSIKFTQEDINSISKDTLVKAKRRKRKATNNSEE